MKKIKNLVAGICVLCIGMTVLLSGCGTEPKELTRMAEFDDCQLEIVDAVKQTDNQGNNYAEIKATYTNNTSEPLYAYCSFKVSAFQNDKSLEDCSDINGNQASLIHEVKNGQKQEVTYLFKLVDESAIEVLVLSPTADEIPLAKAMFE